MELEKIGGVRWVAIKVLTIVTLVYLCSVPIAYAVRASMWGNLILIVIRFLLIVALSVIIRKKSQDVFCTNKTQRKKYMNAILVCDIITVCLHFGVTRKLYGTISSIFGIYSNETPDFLLILWEQLLGRGLYWSILLGLTVVFFCYQRPEGQKVSLS